MLIGITLTSGLARQDAYGEAPVAGVIFGVLAGACYAVFLLVFRRASQAPGPRSGPLLESTVGMAVGALLTAPLDPRFSFAPEWPAHAWLMLLAIVGASHRLAPHRARAGGIAAARHLDPAARPAGVRPHLGKAHLRRASLAIPVAWHRSDPVGVATISMSGAGRKEAAQSAA